jgi:glycosyltransferase involved in cell wall biosynthesis
MIRLLHVHDRDADFQAARAVEQLMKGLGVEFDGSIRTVGTGGDYGHFASAAIHLRGEALSCDLVHAWGARALSAVAFGPFAQILFTPTAFPTRRQIAWLRAIMSYRNVQVICPTTTMHRALAGRGVPLDRCHLIRPGVDFARIKRRRDPQLRAALGFADGHQVLLGVGESTRDANHYQAVWAAAILNVLDRNTRLLLWGRGPMAASAASFGASMAQPELVALAEQKLNRRLDFEDLLAAADAVVISASGPVSTLPIAISMAAALPIVATVTPTVAELLEDRHTALMTQPGVPRLLAQRIMQMRADSQLQWSLADMARTEAYEYFSSTRFLEQIRTIYRQTFAGQKVEVPEQAPGAGLRFHGRA